MQSVCLEVQQQITSADPYRCQDTYAYRFPFTVLDPDPSPRNLGRIEWCVELIAGPLVEGRQMVGTILVWARQTRDPQYVDKIFEIRCEHETLGGHRYTQRGVFTDTLSRMFLCDAHHGVILVAYPGDKHAVLVVDLAYRPSLELRFEES